VAERQTPIFPSASDTSLIPSKQLPHHLRPQTHDHNVVIPHRDPRPLTDHVYSSTLARLPNALREVNRLIGAGRLKDRRLGLTRLVSADLSSPHHQPQVQIPARSFGPVQVVGDELAAREKIGKSARY
jgi:hypothetical protein